MRILIVDDDESCRILLKAILVQQGHEVLECQDAFEAMTALKAPDAPTLIILDWQMPQKTGLKVCREIREMPDSESKYVIMLTARSERDDILAGLRVGANDYLTKPIQAMEIKSRVDVGISILELKKVIALQQASLMNSARIAAIGELAAGVAHEINNPLAIIQLNVDCLSDIKTKFPADRDLVKSACETVSSSVDRIAQILKGLKYFAMEADDEPNEKTGLSWLIMSTLALCNSRYKNHGVELVWEPRTQAIEFECCSGQILQVLYHLLNNAFQAVLPLAEKWIHLDVQEIGPDIQISITDSGRGIAPNLRPKLMLPFFTTRQPGQGQGLGLSITKGIVEKHGGKLWLDENSPNTRFVITLPKKQRSMATSKRSAA